MSAPPDRKADVTDWRTELAGALARRFGCTRPSILSWFNGNTAPHPAMRPVILAAIKESRRDISDEVTHMVIRDVMTWLRRASIESREVGDETRADTLLEIADDISDGEWRR